MYITKSKKSPYYQLTYEVNGKRTTVSTKTRSKNGANQFLSKFEHGLHEEAIKIALIKLSKFQAEYENYISLSKSKSYLSSVQFSFRQLIEFTGDIPLTRFSTRLIDQFITKTYARTEFGAALFYRTLKAAFSKAVVWNYIKENPFKKIRTPRTRNSLPVFINETELQKILDNTKEQLHKDIFLTAFYTGMRRAEIINMRWNWLDLDKKIITVRVNKDFSTKSKSERTIPISSKLIKVFKDRYPKVMPINSDKYVFTRVKHIKLNDSFISKQFKKAVRKAGLDERIHFHTLRHSLASMLVQKGVSLYVIKELLGHQNLTTTQIYSHLTVQNLHEAVNLL